MDREWLPAQLAFAAVSAVVIVAGFVRTIVDLPVGKRGSFDANFLLGLLLCLLPAAIYLLGVRSRSMVMGKWVRVVEVEHEVNVELGRSHKSQRSEVPSSSASIAATSASRSASRPGISRAMSCPQGGEPLDEAQALGLTRFDGQLDYDARAAERTTRRGASG